MITFAPTRHCVIAALFSCSMPVPVVWDARPKRTSGTDDTCGLPSGSLCDSESQSDSAHIQARRIFICFELLVVADGFGRMLTV